MENAVAAGQEFVLPGGYLDSTGVVQTDVVLQEMTGVDEENIANPNVLRNGGKIITTLLANCVKKLGTVPVTDEVIRSLLIGDRDFLMLKLRQITLGDNFISTVTCPKCSTKFEVSVNLNELEIRKCENPLQEFPFTLPKGYADASGIHKDGAMKLPTGVEQEFLSSDAARNRGSATTALLTRCCVRLGTLKAVTQTIVRNMSHRDREVMAKILTENMPGPVLELSNVCPSCGESWIAPMQVSDFFVNR